MVEYDRGDLIPNSEIESNIKIPENLGIANVAGLIEASIERNCKFDCDDCSTIFETDEKMDDSTLFIKNKKMSFQYV